MTTSRPYRDALSVDVAVAELREHAGTQFDPNVVEVLLRRLEHDLGHLFGPASAPTT
jgi:HD-GYP domain-containing protein (c-di-GMP phosphodiesterase class II)